MNMPLREPSLDEARPIAWPQCLPPDLLPALRSDHAGETGAVEIYRGVLAITRDPEVRAFAEHHLETERRHLEWMNQLLPRQQHSRLLPLWRLAGWITGALPALFGAPAVYRTIDAVETFVDLHYSEQIDSLSASGEHADLRALLEACRADEIEHREDARGRLGEPGLIGRGWAALVGSGSRAGVYFASRY